MLSCIPYRLYLSALALSGVAYAFNGSVTDYAPLVNQPCPNITTNPLVRSFTPKNQSLHPREESYVDTRLSTVIPNEWQNWIGDGSSIGYNLSQFIVNVNSTIATPGNASFPKIGIAISGGGYRAAQYGAGVLSALDARNGSAKTAGTGGLLQVTSYLSGLSGVLQSQLSLFFASFIAKETLRPLMRACNVLLACYLRDEAWFTDMPLV
jgi:lysophospholipase